MEVESTRVTANSFLVLIQRSQSTACKHAWSINLKLQHSLSNVQSVICTTQQGKSAKQTKRYLFDAELSLLIIRKFGSHEAFSESTLSYRRSQYVISIFFESIMIREFLLYMQPKNPKIIITKLGSVYVNSYMFFSVSGTWCFWHAWNRTQLIAFCRYLGLIHPRGSYSFW